MRFRIKNQTKGELFLKYFFVALNHANETNETIGNQTEPE
jgi:hypothetical protein